MITDNLSDNFGISLVITTIVFTIVLACTFAAWFAREKTLSIDTIVTSKREGLYSAAVLVTFALGSAAGDLSAKRLNLGYLTSVSIFAGLAAVVYVSRIGFNANPIRAFWIAYILTRLLGASIGDYLAQPRNAGGLGLGTRVTSAIFLVTILAVVGYLTSSNDLIEQAELIEHGAAETPSARGRLSPVLSAIPRYVSPPTRRQRHRHLSSVRQRAPAGRSRFVLLVPNPAHLDFDRSSDDTSQAERVIARALTALEHAAGAHVEGLVATSPNAYDDVDIVTGLGTTTYDEIILETPPSHVSHWLHLDLPQRIAKLGYPLTTVTATP